MIRKRTLFECLEKKTLRKLVNSLELTVRANASHQGLVNALVAKRVIKPDLHVLPVLSVVELKAVCDVAELSAKGKKADLLARLMDFYQASPKAVSQARKTAPRKAKPSAEKPPSPVKKINKNSNREIRMPDFKNIQELEKRLWNAADELRANTGLTSQEYSRPVLGLIFLRYAEYRYELAKERMAANAEGGRKRRGGNDIKTAIQAEGAMYVPDDALFSNLLKLPEDIDLGKAVNDAMKALETENEAIKDALPKSFTVFDNAILVSLLKNFANIRFDIGSDVFGRIYEYFLTEFARSEGQGGGEFFIMSSTFLQSKCHLKKAA